MPIKTEFDIIDPDDFISNVEETIETLLQSTMLEIVIAAKNNIYAEKDYTDQTHNLRSSIGYIIYKNGEIIDSYFKIDGETLIGVQEGKKIAEEVGRNFSNGYVCVFVAGMDYAIYVESKGYGVITPAFNQFDSIFQKNAEEIRRVTGINFKKAK